MNDRKNEIEYLLGIDGGGTKTEFLLTDLCGKEIRRKVLGSSNPVNIGIENTKSILRQGISEICADRDLKQISVFAGLAGGISGDNKSVIGSFLSDFGFGAADNGSDTDNALEAALKKENGVAVIMGTGIIGYTQIDGVKHRIGGWGYLIDKGGSGFSYGSDALDCAFRHLDGRGGSSVIFQLVEERLNKPLAEAVADIYSGGAAYIASFAPAVFQAYEKGDNEAEKIIEKNTKEAARIIKTGFDFLENKDGKAVICGGMCRRKDILEPFLIRHLGTDYPLIFSDEPVINGAIALAKSNIG